MEAESWLEELIKMMVQADLEAVQRAENALCSVASVRTGWRGRSLGESWSGETRFVVSADFIRRSVALEIDETFLRRCGKSRFTRAKWGTNGHG